MKIAQREALINEYKGNLFEYLLGIQLAQYYGLEAIYQKSLPHVLRERLNFYEDFLLQHDRELYRKLPLLAMELSQNILPHLPDRIQNLRLVGKVSGQNEREEWGEADLLLEEDNGLKKISLKLCKENAFVNTKSAGLKSFIEKYFSSFSNASLLQGQLNDKVEKDFYKMAHSLYEKMGLDFKGHFDKTWIDAGLSELPGELETSLSKIVLTYYSEQAQFLRNCLIQFYEKNPQAFCRSLLPLVGLTGDNILQVICFHGVVGNEKYKLKEVSLMDFNQFDDKLDKVTFVNSELGKSSFEILIDKMVLQIRCKPMNKFTVPALKINCSIKKG